MQHVFFLQRAVKQSAKYNNLEEQNTRNSLSLKVTLLMLQYVSNIENHRHLY